MAKYLCGKININNKKNGIHIYICATLYHIYRVDASRWVFCFSYFEYSCYVFIYNARRSVHIICKRCMFNMDALYYLSRPYENFTLNFYFPFAYHEYLVYWEVCNRFVVKKKLHFLC